MTRSVTCILPVLSIYSVTTKNRKATRQELLEELESIRAYLGGDDASTSLDTDAPVITEQRSSTTENNAYQANKIISDSNSNSEADITTAPQQPSNAMKPLPGQQSLFEAPLEKQTSEPEAAIKNPVSENPFLPKHIREKLDREKSRYQQNQDLQKNYQQNKAPVSHRSTDAHTSTADEALIDELVAMYLPKIEEDLRQKLRDKLKRDGAQKKTTE